MALLCLPPRKVLLTLDQTRKDVRKMKESIKGVSKEFEEAKEKTSTLMSTLTQRATVLEKLKAKVGIATALSAFLQLNELSDEEEEEEDLLKEGELLFFDSLVW
jgi:dynein heavy chain